MGKVPILVGVKLFVGRCPKTKEEIEYMAHVRYASVVGSMMYAMVLLEKYFPCSGSIDKVHVDT